MDRIEEARIKLEEMKDNLDLSLLEESVKRNYIEFTYEDKEYKVRLLKMKDKEILHNLRVKKFGALLKDKEIMLESDLRKTLKEKGIDIEEIDDKINKLQLEKKSILMKLGESIANKESETIWKTYEEDVKEFDNKVNSLLIQKCDLLNYSLENQLQDYVLKVIAFLSAEIKSEGLYLKLFSSIEDFDNCEDEKLAEKIVYYSTLINYA